MKAKPVLQHLAEEQRFLSRDVGVRSSEPPWVQPKDHAALRATEPRLQSSRTPKQQDQHQGSCSGPHCHRCDRNLARSIAVRVGGWGVFPSSRSESMECVTMRKHGSQLYKRILERQQIKEEPEDQRRPWESRNVEYKCKASFVRESGHFLCRGTGLTDQNRFCPAQYYALAAASAYFREKTHNRTNQNPQFHHSTALVQPCITTVHSSFAPVTGRSASHRTPCYPTQHHV